MALPKPVKRSTVQKALRLLGISEKKIQDFTAEHDKQYPHMVLKDRFFTPHVEAFVVKQGRAIAEFIAARAEVVKKSFDAYQPEEADLPKRWNYEDGELTGTVESFKSWNGKDRRGQDKIHQMVRIRELSGHLMEVYLAPVLESNFQDQRITEGDEVRITFLGKKPVKDGSHEYSDFRVEVV